MGIYAHLKLSTLNFSVHFFCLYPVWSCQGQYWFWNAYCFHFSFIFCYRHKNYHSSYFDPNSYCEYLPIKQRWKFYKNNKRYKIFFSFFNNFYLPRGISFKKIRKNFVSFIIFIKFPPLLNW